MSHRSDKAEQAGFHYGVEKMHLPSFHVGHTLSEYITRGIEEINMKKMIRMAVATGVMAISVQANAAPDQQAVDRAFHTLREAISSSSAADTASVRLSLKEIMKLLRAEGYTDVVERANSTVLFLSGDTKYVLKAYDDGDLQLYHGLAGIQVNYAHVNQWNQEKRLSRAYIDSEGDPVLEADLLSNGGISRENIKEFVKVFVGISAPAYEEFISESASQQSRSVH